MILWAGAAGADPPGRSAWEALGREPGIAQVQAAVEQREDDPAVAAGLSGSRWAYALPHRVSVRLRQQDESNWTGTLYDDEGWRRSLRGADDFGWQVDVEWDLSRLLHNPEWARAVREAESTRRRQDAAVDLATRLYYERRRLQVRYLLSPDAAEPMVRSRLWLDIAELTARLDAMTGGLYHRAGVVWWEDLGGVEAGP